jgi:hypothetical protein
MPENRMQDQTGGRQTPHRSAQPREASRLPPTDRAFRTHCCRRGVYREALVIVLVVGVTTSTQSLRFWKITALFAQVEFLERSNPRISTCTCASQDLPGIHPK